MLVFLTRKHIQQISVSPK